MDCDAGLVELLEEAIEMEIEGSELYDRLRAQCSDHRVSEVFKLLLEDEAEHIKIFKDLLSTFTEGTPMAALNVYRLRRCGVFDEVKKDFDRAKVRESMMFKEGARYGVADAMGIAIEGELKAIDHYRQVFDKLKGSGEVDDDVLNIIRLILTQEIMHHRYLLKQRDYLRRNSFWVDIEEFKEYRDYSLDSLRDEVDTFFMEAVELTDL